MIDRRISVIIPTFNRKNFIGNALQSVFAQSLLPYEVLVVDDGSTDGTEAFVRAFSKTVKYIKKKNGGASSARNLGIRESTGDWLAFLDSDDTWLPGKLKAQIDFVESSQTAICFSRSQDEEGTFLDDIALMDPALPAGGQRSYEHGDFRVLRHKQHPLVPAGLFSRDTIIRAGCFDESLKVAEDTRLVYRLAVSNRYGVLNIPTLAVKRNRSTPGLSDDVSLLMALERYSCYARVQSEAYWQVLPHCKRTAKVLRRNRDYFISRWAQLACIAGETQLGCELGWHTIKHALELRQWSRGFLAVFAPRLLVRLSRKDGADGK